MLEEKLKELIIEKYGSIRQFAIKIDIPYTTVDTILKRGVNNSNIGNVIAVLLMFSPLCILVCNDKLNSLDFWGFLICSIIYDVYYYSLMQREENMQRFMEEKRRLYNNISEGILCRNDEKKAMWHQMMLEDIIDTYFKNK